MEADPGPDEAHVTRQLDASASAEPDDAELARLLAVRGVPAEEIAKLLKRADEAHQTTGGAPDELSVSCPIPGPKFVPTPQVDFPEFRETSEAEQAEADRLLRDAHLARRRGDHARAKTACETAVAKSPRDASALELYGDILQGVGRVDDAIAAYRRAGEADPARRSAERKYAELLLLQDRGLAAFQAVRVPRNPYLAVLLSAVCPGAGQYYNGEIGKAFAIAVGALALIAGLVWSPLSLSYGMGTGTVVLLLGAAALYIYGLADAGAGARRVRPVGSGWDV